MLAILCINNSDKRSITTETRKILDKSFTFLNININGFLDKYTIKKGLKLAAKKGIKTLIFLDNPIIQKYIKKYNIKKYKQNNKKIAYKVLEVFLKRNPGDIPYIYSKSSNDYTLDCCDVACNFAKTLKLCDNIKNIENIILTEYGISITPAKSEAYIYVLLDEISHINFRGLILDFTKDINHIIVNRELKINLNLGFNIENVDINSIILALLDMDIKLYDKLKINITKK